MEWARRPKCAACQSVHSGDALPLCTQCYKETIAPYMVAVDRQEFVWFFRLVTAMSLQLRSRLNKEAAKSCTNVMLRMQCMAHWIFDRTSLFVLVDVIAKHRHNFSKLIFLLIAMTWGFVSWRNCKLAGGLAYLEELYDTPDFDEAAVISKWQAVSWTRKGYDTNKTIAKLHPNGDFASGLARCLRLLKTREAALIEEDLRAQPNSAMHTLKVLRSTGRLPFFPALVTTRYLILLSSKYGAVAELAVVGDGAVPEADALARDDVQWDALTMDDCNRTSGRQYDKILKATEALLEKTWVVVDGPSPGQYMPPYIVPDVQFVQSNFCEGRKAHCESSTASKAYVPGESDRHDDMTWSDRVLSFESIFVVSGKLRPLLDAEGPTLALPASQAEANITAHVARDSFDRPPEAKRDPMSFRAGDRCFMTTSAFCRSTLPNLSRTSNPRRMLLEKHSFPLSALLYFYGGSLREVEKKYRHARADVLSNATATAEGGARASTQANKRWAMATPLLAKETCSEVLYDVETMRELLKNHQGRACKRKKPLVTKSCKRKRRTAMRS